MKKIDLPLILDVLFYTACAWFLGVGILRFYRVPFDLALTVASLIALAAGGICFLLIYSRHRKRALTKSEQQQKEKLMLHLTLERPEKVYDALVRTYISDGKEPLLNENELRVNGEIFVPLFTMQHVSADAVAILLRKYGEEPFTLLCNELSPEAEHLLLSFGRKAIRGNEIYALFMRTGTMPEKFICGDIPRPKLKVRLKVTFSKRNARPFFVSGILLLIMSLFTFFPLYYLISGSILLIVAVCVRMVGFA